MIPFPTLGRASRPGTPSSHAELPTRPLPRARIDSRTSATGLVQAGNAANATSTLTAAEGSPNPHFLAQVTSRHDRESKGRIRRPETPLDFLHTMHRRVRSSMDSERLERALDAQLVDHPKGVPYAFPDDLTTGPAVVGSTSSSHRTHAAASGTPGAAPARRLGTLRENTRSKLASLSGFGREPKRPVDEFGRGEGHGAISTTRPAPYSAPASNGVAFASTSTSTATSPATTPRPGLPARSASYATGQPLTSRPAAATQRHPSMFLPATPGLTDDTSTITLESASSSADEHDQTAHITLSSSSQAYAASIASTQSSTSHRRERVMGLTVNGREPSIVGTKAFVPQKVSDVVPFAEGHPFAAWDAEDAGAKTHRQPSVRLSKKEQVNDSDDRLMRSARAAPGEPGWKLDVKGKKTWTGDVGTYRVGWERIVLDMEARVHEALWEINESHTFADFADGQEPRTVLDIGTGAGLWPISQALVWPYATFVGLDHVPCQTDLGSLVQSEKRARSTSEGLALGEGMWEGVAGRITWEHANLLERLPFDDAVFDMVHMRFCGLGIPESKWYDLLEECARVLKKGGTLEIVEMAYTPPITTPPSVRNAFASLLLADMIQPSPLLPLQSNLPACEGLKATVKPTWERSFAGTTVFSEAVMCWVRSALGYKGTGLKRGSEWSRVLAELGAVDPVWAAVGDREDGHEGDAEEGASEVEQGTSVWVWVVTRR